MKPFAAFFQVRLFQLLPVLLKTISPLLFVGCYLNALGKTPQPAFSLHDGIQAALAVPSTVTLAAHRREIANRDIVQASAGFLAHSAFDSDSVCSGPSPQDRSRFTFIGPIGIRQVVALASLFQSPERGR